MSSASIKKIIPCKKEQLVEMVLDIEKYPEFVPWCIEGKVFDKNESIDLITAEQDYKIAAGVVEKGKISGQRRKWTGNCEDGTKIIQETIWRAHPDAAPEWEEPVGMCVEVKGKPNMKIDFSHDWNDDPLVSTALHGIHAIPLVCEASPGFKSFLDLPLISSKFN